MDNPLRQYFRRPAIYLKLPSQGKYYPPGTIDLPENGEVPIYPMTAIDEITSKTPDALFNGMAVIEIIKSCIPNIKDPNHIPVIDLDAILIGIKSASSGNDMEIVSACPECETESNYTISMVSLLSKLQSGNYDQSFSKDELIFSFKPLTYKVLNEINLIQFNIQKKMQNYESILDEEIKSKQTSETMREITKISTKLIAETISSITTPISIVEDKKHIAEFLENCDKNTYESIRLHVIKLRSESELKPLEIKCGNCGHQYSQILSLNVTDFFV